MAGASRRNITDVDVVTIPPARPIPVIQHPSSTSTPRKPMGPNQVRQPRREQEKKKEKNTCRGIISYYKTLSTYCTKVCQWPVSSKATTIG